MCHKNLDNRSEAESHFLKALQITPHSAPLFEDFLSSRDSNLEDLPRILDNLHFTPANSWLKQYFLLYNTKQSLDTFLSFKFQPLKQADQRGIRGRENQLEKQLKSQSQNQGLCERNNQVNRQSHQNDQTSSSKNLRNQNIRGNEDLARKETEFMENNFLINDTPNRNENDSQPIEEENQNPEKRTETRKVHNGSSNSQSSDSVIQNLIEQGNSQLLYMKAKSLFENYELNEAYKVCKRILTLNSFHVDTLLIYSELLVERKVEFDFGFENLRFFKEIILL